MTEQRPIGAPAAEAALLLDTVAQRLETFVTAAATDDPAGAPASGATDSPPAAHEQGCTGCPVCRFLGVLRGERPEVAARWADGALQVVNGLRTLLEATNAGASPASGTPPGPGAAPSTAAPTGAPAPKVSRIDVD